MANDFKNYYRPKDFNQVVGQDEAVSILRGMIKKNRIAHSILIDGAFGTGKTTLARIFAKHICCLNYDHQNCKPCGECSSCKSFGKGNSVDNHISITEVNGSADTGIDFYKNLIQTAKRTPIGKYNVYIIDEAHRMSTAAQNAFLKCLEEPPEKTVFIFCTTDSQLLLPTIHSRLTKITLGVVSIEAQIKYLARICKKEDRDIDESILKKIAEASDGHLRDATNILESCCNAIDDGKDITKINFDKFIENSSVANPFKLATEYLISLYKGTLASVGYLNQLDDNGIFLLFTKVIQGLQTEALYSCINFKLLSLKTKDFWKYKELDNFVNNYVSELDKKQKSDFVFAMSDMANDIVALTERMKNYGVHNPRFLCAAFTISQAKRFKKLKK